MLKIYRILKTMVWCLIGVWIGGSIYQCLDYRKRPDFYAMRSAPWYLELIVHGVFTLILIVVLLLILYAMKQKMKKEQCDVKCHAVNTDQKQSIGK